MKTIINSRKHGEIAFVRPGAHYVYIDLDGKRQQICDGGELLGSTVTFEGNDQTAFDRYCRRWWKKYLKNERW
jgi:hypothetical protein